MAEPPTKRRSRVSRRIGNDDPVTESAARRHTQLKGELLWAWNELHGALCHLFTGLVDPDNLYMGMSLWNAIANESAQRDLEKVCAKLKVRTRIEAVASAVRQGLIEPG